MGNVVFPVYKYDDDLLQAARRDGQARVRVCRFNETVVVLGKGSRPELEIHQDACAADRVPILRRRGGGCAVVLDPGNVVVSVVAAGLPFGQHHRHFDALSNWLIDGMARIGIPGINQAGICDLVFGDRKIGGACLHRSRDLLYYSVSLLIDPDLDKVARYLRHPPREPSYRQGRSHPEFMGSLATLLRSAPLVGPDRASHLAGHPDPRAAVDAEQVAQCLRRTLQPPGLEDLRKEASNSRRHPREVVSPQMRPARHPGQHHAREFRISSAPDRIGLHGNA